MRAKNPTGPRLKPHRRRILEAILFLIWEAEKQGSYVTQYEIVKSLFIADTNHLAKFGRPITFDNYAAMKHGPVPSESFDMLKPGYPAARYFDELWPIWRRDPSPADGPRAFKFHSPRRRPNLRVLSESDRVELSGALKTVKALQFGGTRDFTHRNPAYIDAWRPHGGKLAYDMNYLLLLPGEDQNMLLDLVHASKHM